MDGVAAEVLGVAAPVAGTWSATAVVPSYAGRALVPALLLAAALVAAVAAGAWSWLLVPAVIAPAVAGALAIDRACCAGPRPAGRLPRGALGKPLPAARGPGRRRHHRLDVGLTPSRPRWWRPRPAATVMVTVLDVPEADALALAVPRVRAWSSSSPAERDEPSASVGLRHVLQGAGGEPRRDRDPGVPRGVRGGGAHGRGVPARGTAGPSTGSRPTRPTRSASAATPARLPRARVGGRIRNCRRGHRLYPGYGSCPRTPTSRRRAPTAGITFSPRECSPSPGTRRGRSRPPRRRCRHWRAWSPPPTSTRPGAFGVGAALPAVREGRRRRRRPQPCGR